MLCAVQLRHNDRPQRTFLHHRLRRRFHRQISAPSDVTGFRTRTAYTRCVSVCETHLICIEQITYTHKESSLYRYFTSHSIRQRRFSHLRIRMGCRPQHSPQRRTTITWSDIDHMVYEQRRRASTIKGPPMSTRTALAKRHVSCIPINYTYV